MLKLPEASTVQDIVYDAIRFIRDPEFPSNSLEELKVVSEEQSVQVQIRDNVVYVSVIFRPTVPTCTMSSIIGLCIVEQIRRQFEGEPYCVKVDVGVDETAHPDAHLITRQLQDKERVAAALENPILRDVINNCLRGVEEY